MEREEREERERAINSLCIYEAPNYLDTDSRKEIEAVDTFIRDIGQEESIKKANLNLGFYVENTSVINSSDKLLEEVNNFVYCQENPKSTNPKSTNENFLHTQYCNIDSLLSEVNDLIGNQVNTDDMDTDSTEETEEVQHKKLEELDSESLEIERENIERYLEKDREEARKRQLQIRKLEEQQAEIRSEQKKQMADRKKKLFLLRKLSRAKSNKSVIAQESIRKSECKYKIDQLRSQGLDIETAVRKAMYLDYFYKKQEI